MYRIENNFVRFENFSAYTSGLGQTSNSCNESFVQQSVQKNVFLNFNYVGKLCGLET